MSQVGGTPRARFERQGPKFGDSLTKLRDNFTKLGDRKTKLREHLVLVSPQLSLSFS